MYNAQVLSTSTMQWVMAQALNELNAYLCEGDPYADNGRDWPEIARENAAHCRAIADAAIEPSQKEVWEGTAAQYESAI